ncbi:MAG TPA: ATP-binding protein [Pseudolabrys sp.]|nr:ATP-binding protein [Pseudolabrys sp.]
MEALTQTADSTMTDEVLRILIVDDDHADRRHVMHVMKEAGLPCSFVETVSLEDAVEACKQQTFEFAIVDYHLPGADGLNCISYFQARIPDMPVVMITGRGDEIVAAQAIKAGAMDYIPKKNVQEASIRRIVKTALERAELRRRIAQQQEELEKFAAVLVHDLRAPITAVQAFARYIESGLRATSPDRDTISDHCRGIVKAVRRMDALINTLYKYTKADAEITLHPVDMNQVMVDAMTDLQNTIKERRARIKCGNLPVVAGDASELTELLENLIGNSLKYCEAETPIVDVTAAPDGKDTWRFAVKDNGIGISEQYRQKIFAPFERLHGTGKYDGAGLGLAICKKIVERHGGTIWCESSASQGTIFFFTLKEAV